MLTSHPYALFSCILKANRKVYLGVMSLYNIGCTILSHVQPIRELFYITLSATTT